MVVDSLEVFGATKIEVRTRYFTGVSIHMSIYTVELQVSTNQMNDAPRAQRISRSNARAKEAVVTDGGAGCVGRAHSPAVNADILSDRPWRPAAPGGGYGVGWFKRPLLQLHGISSGPSAELFMEAYRAGHIFNKPL
ncbi:hypothetical protein ACQJBY_029012 [Aegilops geniculata]